jgi:hypothetical protein
MAGPIRSLLCAHSAGSDLRGCWYDHIAGRPAYKQLSDAQLRSAIALAEALVAGHADLHALNAASLGWRSDRRRRVEPGLI